MTTDRPPLLMAHIDPGIGRNISMCVLRTNVIDIQTDTKHNNVAKVIYKYGQNKR